MAASDITILTLTATPTFRGNKISWTYNDPWALTGLHYRLDAVEVWASTTNDRTTASKVGEGVTDFLHAGLAEEQTYYYWAKARDRAPPSGAYGPFFPTSTTAGVACVAIGMSGLAFGLANGKIVASVAANALTIAVKTLAGTDPSSTDPVYVAFRSATVSNAAYQARSIAAALSLTVPSGATLGASASTPFRLWLVLFDDGGTLRLAVMNTYNGGVSIRSLQDYQIDGAISIDASADFTAIFYADAGIASKAYRIIGFLEWTSGLGTPGTWSAGPDIAKLFGLGDIRPGDRFKPVMSRSSSEQHGSTTIPFDDTLPQITEGTQFYQDSFTPTSPANLIEYETIINCSHSVAGVTIIAALFIHGTSNAIASAWGYASAIDSPCRLHLKHQFVGGTTSAILLDLRVGASAAGTVTINGQGSARKLGGSLETVTTITEIMV